VKIRAILWVAGSLLVPLVALVVAKQVFDIDQAEFFAMMQSLSNSPWAIPITITLFCGMAFIGAPQWMLITGTVLAFGPWQGGGLSWAASLTSAMMGFALI